MRLYVQPFGTMWVAMIVGDKASPPQPGQLGGIVFAGYTAEDAERLALRYLAGRECVSRDGVGESSPKALKGMVGELVE